MDEKNDIIVTEEVQVPGKKERDAPWWTMQPECHSLPAWCLYVIPMLSATLRHSSSDSKPRPPTPLAGQYVLDLTVPAAADVAIAAKSNIRVILPCLLIGCSFCESARRRMRKKNEKCVSEGEERTTTPRSETTEKGRSPSRQRRRKGGEGGDQSVP